MTDSIYEQWAERDKLIAEKGSQSTGHVETYEGFPAGAGRGTLAGGIVEQGLIYVLNAAVLQTCGYALSVEAATTENGDENPRNLGLWKTSDPEGFSFDALGHEQGIGRLDTATLGSVLTSLRETTMRLEKELAHRSDLSRLSAEGSRHSIEVAVLGEVRRGAATISELIAELFVTPAQASSAVLRLEQAGAIERIEGGAYVVVDSE